MWVLYSVVATAIPPGILSSFAVTINNPLSRYDAGVSGWVLHVILPTNSRSFTPFLWYTNSFVISSLKRVASKWRKKRASFVIIARYPLKYLSWYNFGTADFLLSKLLTKTGKRFPFCSKWWQFCVDNCKKRKITPKLKCKWYFAAAREKYILHNMVKSKY